MTRRGDQTLKAKRVVILVIAVTLFLTAFPATAEQGLFSVNVTINWYLGLRLGVELRPWEHIGMAADIGTTAFSLDGQFVLTYDAFVVVHAFDRQSDLQVSACLGIPDATVVFTDPIAGELPVGASLRLGFGLVARAELFLRLGAGIPFYWEAGTFVRDRVSFPFNLWPDLSVGSRFSL